MAAAPGVLCGTTSASRLLASTPFRAVRWAIRGPRLEIWMPLGRLYESGAYAEAAERGRELIEAHPDYPLPLYNLACCESLAGQTHEAIEHLRLAIARAEQFRSLAAEDSDFDPIRDEPAFKQLLSNRAAEPATG